MIIDWPAGVNGVLQETGDLARASWIHSPSGGAHPITLPITDAAKFYRLSFIPST